MPDSKPSFATGLAFSLLAACGGAQTATGPAAVSGSSSSAEQALVQRARQSFAPLPEPTPQDPKQVVLGRRLFFDTRVSNDGKVGCVTCHHVDKFATDGLRLAVGTDGRVNPRNSPTVFNAFLQSSEHWRGDRESVEDQAKRALLGPPSFGLASDEAAAQKIAALGYEPAFADAFPGAEPAVTTEHWASAIGAFERTLLTKAPFDAYLGGDTVAISSEARAGLAAFLDTGCADCHNGVLLGGHSLAKFGKFSDYTTLTHSDHHDTGRFDITQNEADRDVFKVAPLRNVEHSAPYFHDGSVDSLADAVKIMAKAQLNAELTPEVIATMVAFLSSLSGAIPADYSPPPSAPAAGT
jgi:cytochrome c peroxidase